MSKNYNLSPVVLELLSEAARKNNSNLCKEVYGKKYRYNGNEVIDISKDEKGEFTEIKWCDGTTTRTYLNDGEKKNDKLGIEICVVKKMCPRTDIVKIFEIANGKEEVVEYIFEMLIRASAGNRCYTDIKEWLKSYYADKKAKEVFINRINKNKKRKAAWLAKIEKKKKEGTWFPQKERERIHQEYLALKAKYDTEFELKEIERMKKEMNKKKFF